MLYFLNRKNFFSCGSEYCFLSNLSGFPTCIIFIFCSSHLLLYFSLFPVSYFFLCVLREFFKIVLCSIDLIFHVTKFCPSLPPLYVWILLLYFTLFKRPLLLSKFHDDFFSSSLFSPVAFLFCFIKIMFSRSYQGKPKFSLFFFCCCCCYKLLLQAISLNLQYDAYFSLPVGIFLPTCPMLMFLHQFTFKFLAKDRMGEFSHISHFSHMGLIKCHL